MFLLIMRLNKKILLSEGDLDAMMSCITLITSLERFHIDDFFALIGHDDVRENIFFFFNEFDFIGLIG